MLLKELFTNSQSKNKGALQTLKGLEQYWDRQIFLKISISVSLINTYQMNLISAGSISLDNTFKVGHEVDTASKI
jgi:hypothetical protein